MYNEEELTIKPHCLIRSYVTYNGKSDWRYGPMRHPAQVSFITPTFNRADELKAAIASCLCQTYEKWEMIVVDDHSDKVDIRNIVNIFDDQRVKYFKQSPNLKGEAAARETAINHAESKIYITLDSDDLNHPHRASRCFEILNPEDPCMLYTRVKHFSSSNTSGTTKKIFQPYNAKLLEMINFITNPGTAFNQAAYKTAGSFYNKSLVLATDYDQFLRMSRAGVCMIGLDEIHVSYRKHAGAVTSGSSKALHEAIMQVRKQNNVQPFPLESIQSLAVPELCANILNNENQRDLWKDDRWDRK